MNVRSATWLTMLLLAAAPLACSEDDPIGENGAQPTKTKIQAPVIDTDKTPKAGATKEQTLTVLSTTFIPASPTAEDKIRVDARVTPGAFADYQWYVNDEKLTGRVAAELPPGQHKKGDKVTVEITVRMAGKTGKATRSSPVVVGNLPPKITSNPGGALDGYRATAVDPDGDELTWKLAGAPAGVSISKDGVLSWPGPYKPGKHSIQISVTDATGAGVTQVIPVVIPEGNAAPTAP